MTLSLAGCRLQDIRSDQFDMISTSLSAVTKAARPISDEEEYYVGRAVAANLLTRYRLLKNERLTRYVNQVGQAVALHSDKPTTYGGYHFAILDTGEVNALSCPGGIIFITRGMLATTRNEEELAAVLAHEVAHVNHRDGIAAIGQSRWTEALTVIGKEAAKTYGTKDVARLTGIFEGSIDDVVKTLVVNGYGREQEENADRDALRYLARTGYDAHALRSFLGRLMATGKSSGGGILQTHPATEERIENITANMPDQKIDQSLMQRRERRFRSQTAA